MLRHLTARPAYWCALMFTSMAVALCVHTRVMYEMQLLQIEYETGNASLRRAAVTTEQAKDAAMRRMVVTLKAIPGGK